MTDDFYPTGVWRRCGTSSTMPASDYQADDGELIVAGHRLGVSVTFDGFVQQGEQVIAPLEIQLHLDGDEGNKFRMGTLGIGHDSAARHAGGRGRMAFAGCRSGAGRAGGAGEHAPLAPAAQVGRLELFSRPVGRPRQAAGRARSVGPFLSLGAGSAARRGERLARGRRFCLAFDLPAGRGQRCRAVEVQAAVDGMLDAELTAALAGSGWPRPAEAYLYKQLFVLGSEKQ